MCEAPAGGHWVVHTAKITCECGPHLARLGCRDTYVPLKPPVECVHTRPDWRQPDVTLQSQLWSRSCFRSSSRYATACVLSTALPVMRALCAAAELCHSRKVHCCLYIHSSATVTTSCDVLRADGTTSVGACPRLSCPRAAGHKGRLRYRALERCVNKLIERRAPSHQRTAQTPYAARLLVFRALRTHVGVEASRTKCSFSVPSTCLAVL